MICCSRKGCLPHLDAQASVEIQICLLCWSAAKSRLLRSVLCRVQLVEGMFS